MEKSAVFFDIDGTLWDYEQKIIPSTIEAVRQLRANGHLAFICSGRSRSAITSKELLDIGFDGILGGCGTYFEYQGKVDYSIEIPYETVAKDLKELQRIGVATILEGVDKFYVDREAFGEGDQYIMQLFEKLKDTFRDTKQLDETARVNKYSVDFRNSSREALEGLFPDYNIVVHDKSTVAEIMPGKDFSKAYGIKKVIEELGIPHERTYSFGDSFNDMDMIKYTAHSIAMENGVDKIKELAEYVTSHVNEDGIYNGLKHYGLI